MFRLTEGEKLMYSFKGKTILITGASSGLGAEVALQIASNEGQPILLARSAEKLQSVQSHIHSVTGQLVPFYVADVTNFSKLGEVIASILLTYPTIDVLVNNAGFGIFRSFLEAPIKDFEEMIQVNYLGTVYCTKLLVPQMIQQGYGHIINVASQAGKTGTPKSTAYAASKHALLGFTNSLRHELKTHNVQITAINPGPIHTPFFDRADPSGGYTQRMKKWLLSPERVAKAIVRSIHRPVREVNLPLWMEAGSRLFQLAPTVMEKLLAKQLDKK